MKKIVVMVSFISFSLFLGMGLILNQKENAVSTMSVNNWGLSFQKDNTLPVIDINEDELKEMGGYHIGDENKIYLTFDAGFENGNTAKILDVLKNKNVKACFFLVGNYMEKEPELVKRMVEEGHIVGNHTYHHKDMANMNTKEDFLKELTDLEDLYRQIVGEEMKKYYRPPQGKYTAEQLNWAKEKGYKTIFWSLAYVDWEEDNQPSREEAMEKLTKRIHPGAIVLLHSTSNTNGEILQDIIEKWQEMGYEFGTLDEL